MERRRRSDRSPSATYGAGDSNIVCLQEKSKSGTTFSIADVATGANAGTYYNEGHLLDDRRHGDGVDRLVSRSELAQYNS